MNARLPALEWAWRSASGELHGLGWVDGAVTDRGRPFTVGEDGRFRHVPYGAFLPAPMVHAAAEAAARGEPTALEAQLLVFARAEWLVVARGWWFTPFSPIPALLVGLVEAYGIPGEIHRADPDRLAALLAHLPGWYPRRGRFDRAAALLEATGHPPRLAEFDPERERFACRDARWWRGRGARTDLRIEGGVVTTSAPNDHPEDVRAGLPPDAAVPPEVLRLLPVWTSLRLAAAEPAEPASAPLETPR